MKIKVSEATGAQLNWMVAKCEGVETVVNMQADGTQYLWRRDNRPLLGNRLYAPTTDWAQGGPIIERERINLRASGAGDWVASTHDLPHPERLVQQGDTPLIAAMRCFVVSKLGDEVEVPDELS